MPTPDPSSFASPPRLPPTPPAALPGTRASLGSSSVAAVNHIPSQTPCKNLTRTQCTTVRPIQMHTKERCPRHQHPGARAGGCSLTQEMPATLE